jgi:hypothetical protein
VRRAKVGVQEIASNDAVALASKSVSSQAGSLTQTNVTARRKAFRVRQWTEGYKQNGRRDPACDAEILQFFETWISSNYGGALSTNGPSATELANQLATNSAACEDPLVLAGISAACNDSEESIRHLERALRGFEQSKHKAYPRLYATVVLGNELPKAGSRLRTLDASALELFKTAFQDGSFTAQDQPEVLEILENGWGKNFYYRNRGAMLPAIKAAGKPFQWLALVLEGQYHVDAAWEARGSGYADSVTADGWKGFAKHLALARQSYTKAWELRPDLPHAAAEMITVAMGDSDAEQMRLWFDRALAAQIDYDPAWSHLRWGLRPRWFGSLEAMQALGQQALNTKRYDTDVPRKFFDVVKDLEEEQNLPAGKHIYGRADVWPGLRQMYEGYIAETARSDSRDGWRSTYAIVASLAGEYDTAREQLQSLNWEPHAWDLTGWGTDLSLLPLEVAARTSPLRGEIDRAEEARRRGDVTEALRFYAGWTPTNNVDERTRKFIQHRQAALGLEKRLAGGEWIDFLPAEDNDLNWVGACGKYRRMPDGALEVTPESYGHMLFSRVRVGPAFEIKGKFEATPASNKSFKAGLVFGVPDRYNQTGWYAVRMTRNEAESGLVTFSRAWTRREVHKRVSLEDRNEFVIRFQDGKATVIVNGNEILHEAGLDKEVSLSPDEVLLGVGAMGERNETGIRYSDFRVRSLLP